MVTTESFQFIRSDYQTDFRNTIPSNASQYANIQAVAGVPRGQVKGYIVSAKLQSIQNLDWRIELHSRRLSEASAPFWSNTAASRYNNIVSYIAFAKEQATAYATSFLYYRDGLKIPYLDEDGLGEVHVNLLNTNATTKLPGDSGAVHIAFGFVAGA